MTEVRSLVVSLHDVAPPFVDEISRQLSALSKIGVSQCVFMVVPNWHGSAPVSRSPALIELLQSQIAAGSQIVLHGTEHRLRGSIRGSPIRLARAKAFAPSAAEFMSMTGVEACESVRSGVAEVERAHLPAPDTFCAPGWLLTDEAETFVAEAGITRLAGMVSYVDLQAGRLYWTPSFGFMGAGTRQEIGVKGLTFVMKRLLNKARVTQVYLHPDPIRRDSWLSTVAAVGDLVRSGWRPSVFSSIQWEPSSPDGRPDGIG